MYCNLNKMGDYVDIVENSDFWRFLKHVVLGSLKFSQNPIVLNLSIDICMYSCNKLAYLKYMHSPSLLTKKA